MCEVNHPKAGTCSGNLFSVFLVVFSYSHNNVKIVARVDRPDIHLGRGIVYVKLH